METDRSLRSEMYWSAFRNIGWFDFIPVLGGTEATSVVLNNDIGMERAIFIYLFLVTHNLILNFRL